MDALVSEMNTSGKKYENTTQKKSRIAETTNGECETKKKTQVFQKNKTKK